MHRKQRLHLTGLMSCLLLSSTAYSDPPCGAASDEGTQTCLTKGACDVAATRDLYTHYPTEEEAQFDTNSHRQKRRKSKSRSWVNHLGTVTHFRG